MIIIKRPSQQSTHTGTNRIFQEEIRPLVTLFLAQRVLPPWLAAYP